MNLSISHDSEVEVIAFPFLFLEVFLALGVINGYGKTKSNAFTTLNLKCLLVPEQKKKERKKEKKKKIEEMEWALCFGQGGEVVFRLCENEGVKMGLYRGGEGVYVMSG